MNSQPDKEEAADNVLNASLPFLKSDECERVMDHGVGSSDLFSN